MTVVGRTYYERGQPVEVRAQWLSSRHEPERRIAVTESIYVPKFTKRNGPRNVLIRRCDGTLVVRPFRGLRRKP